MQRSKKQEQLVPLDGKISVKGVDVRKLTAKLSVPLYCLLTVASRMMRSLKFSGRRMGGS
jgi:hypothetical protein